MSASLLTCRPAVALLVSLLLAGAIGGCGGSRYVTVEGEFYRQTALVPGTTLPETTGIFRQEGTSETWRIEPNDDFDRQYADLTAATRQSGPLENPVVRVRLSGWQRPSEDYRFRHRLKVDQVHQIKAVGQVPSQLFLPPPAAGARS